MCGECFPWNPSGRSFDQGTALARHFSGAPFIENVVAVQVNQSVFKDHPCQMLNSRQVVELNWSAVFAVTVTTGCL